GSRPGRARGLHHHRVRLRAHGARTVIRRLVYCLVLSARAPVGYAASASAVPAPFSWFDPVSADPPTDPTTGSTTDPNSTTDTTPTTTDTTPTTTDTTPTTTDTTPT